MEISQNALVRSRHLYSQLSIFEGSLADLLRFWCCPRKKMRQSRRIASFLMLLTSKIKKVSQNWFVFDGANFKNAGSLAELLSFWCCQLQTLRMSRRIASLRRTFHYTTTSPHCTTTTLHYTALHYNFNYTSWILVTIQYSYWEDIKRMGGDR